MSLDFIIGLLDSLLSKYHLDDLIVPRNAILIVIDRLSKIAHFIAINDTITGRTTAILYRDYIIRLYSLPSKIILD